MAILKIICFILLSVECLFLFKFFLYKMILKFMCLEVCAIWQFCWKETNLKSLDQNYYPCSSWVTIKTNMANKCLKVYDYKSSFKLNIQITVISVFITSSSCFAGNWLTWLTFSDGFFCIVDCAYSKCICLFCKNIT